MTDKPKAFVAYLRVSTSRQGESGLGLEAQRAAIAVFARQQGIEIHTEYVEVETGKGHDALERRPNSPPPSPMPSASRSPLSSPSSAASAVTCISSPA